MRMSPSKLTSAREDAGWSQADLAAATGLSRPFVSQLESGTRSPSPSALHSIAVALGMEVQELKDTGIECPHCGKKVY